MKNISDKYGRTFKKLRVSLNNICNFSCLYCVSPEEEARKKAGKSKADTLPGLNDYIQIIKSLHNILNLQTIRLTGGEPLLYKSLVPLVQAIKEAGIPEVSMTTNASMLDKKAHALKQAGLDSLNISLDALHDKASETMTRRSQLDHVMKGIKAGQDAGIPMKINAVIMKGINDKEIIPLLNFGKKENITVRFLELMKMGHLYGKHSDYFYTEEEMLQQIRRWYQFYPLERKPSATANYWQMNDGYTFGVIANHSRPFCADCNRLRLDSQGKVYGCLSNPFGTSVMEALSNNEELEKILRKALNQKQDTGFTGSSLSMKAIGG